MAGRTGWSASGVLVTRQGSGKGTEVSANPRGPQVTLQVDLAAAGEFTIAFDLRPIDIKTGPFDNVIYMCEALIEMSIAGNTITRRVSLAAGTTVQGIAQSIRVIAWDVTPQPGLYSQATGGPNNRNEFVPNLRYQVSISIARGHRATAPSPPVLIPPLAIVPFGTAGLLATNVYPGVYFPQAASTPPFAFIPVPYDAGVVAALFLLNCDFVPSTNPATGFPLVQGAWGTLEGGSPFLANFGTQWSAQANLSTWVPFVPGSNSFNIFMINNPGANGLEITVNFAIDG